MITHVNKDSLPRLGLRGDVHTFVNACLQPEPATARVGGQLVGASGVVGFWRVKDEPKGVFIAEASASARNAIQIQPIATRRQHKYNNPDTKVKHFNNRRTTT